MDRNPTSNSWLREPLMELLDYCRGNQWAGWDPYDGLSSVLFDKSPLKRSQFCRLVLIQGLKRLPINLRTLLCVPKEQNPKGIALFVSAVIKLGRMGLGQPASQPLVNRLLELKSPGQDFTCWGYNFDWQTRTYLVPKFTPNIICTTFAANALLDAFDASGCEVYLEHAVSAGQFLLQGLNRTARKSGFCFSYTTLDRSQIHNANLLGAALLARLYSHTGSEELRSTALEATRFSVDLQREDGAWPYGEGKHQAWIDSFHTAYNLSALNRIHQCFPENPWLAASLRKGLNFFLGHFFTENGVVKYYHDKIYPIDIHALAQAMITLAEFRDEEPRAIPLACKICQWGLTHMRTSTGTFFYQQHRWHTNRIPYMRWGQAWMALAMASLLEAIENTPQEANPGAEQETAERTALH